MTATHHVRLECNNVFTRWPCATCGGETEKEAVLAVIPAFVEEQGRAFVVCEKCLVGGEDGIRARLLALAEERETDAARLRSEAEATWVLPSHDDWLAAVDSMDRMYGDGPEAEAHDWCQRPCCVEPKSAEPDEQLDHFHGCPECPPSRGPDNIYNAGKAHRAACHIHRTTWMLGANLFDSWRHETEAEQRERYREIDGYTDVGRPRINKRHASES